MLELLVPFAHVLAEVAFGFRGGGGAIEVALGGDGIPFAAGLEVARGLGGISAGLAVGLAESSEGDRGGVTERISVAAVEVEVVGACVLADASRSPLALSVNVGVASSGGEVASGAALDADRVGRIRHAQRGGAAVHHGGDGAALLGADVTGAVPDAVGVGLADFGGGATEAAASLAGGLGGVEVAGGLLLAFLESEGVVGVDEDLRAGGCAGRGFIIPHAASVGDAASLVGVQERAVLEAALGGHVPGALGSARALAGIGDEGALEETLGVLLIPGALRIGVAIVGVGASSAGELADTRDGVGCAIAAAGAVEDISALSVARLLGGAPNTVLRFTTFGVAGDLRAASAALLRGSGPLAAVVGLVIA